jgi:hypothetical protein
MGKPREILRKAHAVIEHGAAENWTEIDGDQAADFLDSLTLPEDDEDVVVPIHRPIADTWATE